MHPDQPQRIDWVVALIATGTAVFLHLIFLLHAGALWRDEVNTLNTATSASLSAMLRRMEFDSFPILWFVLLRAWVLIGAGATDPGLRLLGLMGGLALPAAVWFAALRLRHRPPSVSLAFIAINPLTIRWAATVRAWGLGAALVIIMFVLMREAIRTPSKRSVCIAALAGILGVHSVYQNVVFLAAIITGAVAVALTMGSWKRAVLPIVIGLSAAISLIPYAGIVRRRGEWNLINQTRLTIANVSDSFLEVVSSSGRVVLAFWLAMVAAALTLSVAHAWFSARTTSTKPVASDSTVAYAGVVLAVAVVGFAMFHLSFAYPMSPWYYLGLVALIGVCAEAAIAPLAHTASRRIILATVVVVVLASGFRHAWAALQDPQTNVNRVSARLNADATCGDLIIANPWFYVIPLEHYYRGDAEVTTVPPLDDHKVHRYDLLKRQMLSPNPVAPLVARIEQVLKGGHSVWLVGPRHYATRSLNAGRLELQPIGRPPLPDSGWSLDPYVNAWSVEILRFLAEHALEQSEVPVDRGPPFESAQLMMARGWRP